MTKRHGFEPDRHLSSEEQELVDQLSESEIEEIDAALLSYCTEKWRKVAMIVGSAMMDINESLYSLPDIYFAGRVRTLAQNGLLELQGDSSRMRFSEVRVAKEPSVT